MTMHRLTAGAGYQYLEQVGLLRCCTAFEAYCQVYTADLTADRILEFLLLNRDFPHAIRYSVDGVRQAVEAIQRTGGRRLPDERVVGCLREAVGLYGPAREYLQRTLIGLASNGLHDPYLDRLWSRLQETDAANAPSATTDATDAMDVTDTAPLAYRRSTFV